MKEKVTLKDLKKWGMYSDYTDNNYKLAKKQFKSKKKLNYKDIINLDIKYDDKIWFLAKMLSKTEKVYLFVRTVTRLDEFYRGSYLNDVKINKKIYLFIRICTDYLSGKMKFKKLKKKCSKLYNYFFSFIRKNNLYIAKGEKESYANYIISIYNMCRSIFEYHIKANLYCTLHSALILANDGHMYNAIEEESKFQLEIITTLFKSRRYMKKGK